MPKKSDNFLRGWCRQLREALDEGVELAYEAAELIEELDELLSPGDTDLEMGQSDGDGGSGAEEAPDESSAGDAEDDEPGVSGLDSPAQAVLFPHGNNNEVGVPRGTGSCYTAVPVVYTTKGNRRRGT